MGKFIENPPIISNIVTVIKRRYFVYNGILNPYDDLFLTIFFGKKMRRDYVIHTDNNHNIRHIKGLIDNKQSYEDIIIVEGDRNYLFITIGSNKIIQVTGRRFYPGLFLDEINHISYEIIK